MPVVSRLNRPTRFIRIVVYHVRRCYKQCRRMQRRVNRLH